MIRCACCERRLGKSLAPCECVESHCPKCLLCESHRGCNPQPVRVDWAFLRTVLLIAFLMSLFRVFGLMVFEHHLIPQWVGGVAGALVGIGLVLAHEGLLGGEPDPD